MNSSGENVAAVPNTMRDRHVLARLLAYTRGRRSRWLIGLIMLLAATAADLVGPVLIKHFIDDQLVAQQFLPQQALFLALGYLTIMGVAAALKYRQALLFSGLALEVVARVRIDLFARVIALPLAFFDRSATGALISRITNDTEAVKELFVNVIVNAMQNLFLLVCIFIAMALLDVQLMLLALVLVPVTLGAMGCYKRLSAPLFQKARALLGDINAHLSEALQAMGTLQIFNQERRFRARFTDLVTAHFTTRRRSVRLDGLLLRAFIDLVSMLILAALLGLFGLAFLEGSAGEIGVLYVFIAYLGRFTEPLIEMTQRLNLLQQSLVAGQRVFALMDEPQGIEAGVAVTGAASLADASPAVAFERVSFSYDGIHPVIHEVSFSVPRGHCYALVGHTGSGKSTLANLMLRFYPLTQGDIVLAGVPLNRFGEAQLRRHIAVVQQDALILNASVADNIRLGLSLPFESVVAAAEAAQFAVFVQDMPHGYDTLLGENGFPLSTGQKQLLSLARALARKPEILVLDEATASIDSATEQRVLQTLRALRGKITSLVIAHRLATIKDADQILVLHQGRLVQQGDHADLIQRPGLYQHLYQLQALASHFPQEPSG